MIRLSILLALLALSGCATSSSSKSYEATVDGYSVGWKDFSKVSKMHRERINLPKGQSLYMFTHYKAETVTLSDGTKVTGYPGFACNTTHIQSSGLSGECERVLYKRLLNPTPDSRPSLERFIDMAQEAVAAEGSCTWIGYDRTLDVRARATGALASLNDERVFFAPLTCR